MATAAARRVLRGAAQLPRALDLHGVQPQAQLMVAPWQLGAAATGDAASLAALNAQRTVPTGAAKPSAWRKPHMGCCSNELSSRQQAAMH